MEQSSKNYCVLRIRVSPAKATTFQPAPATKINSQSGTNQPFVWRYFSTNFGTQTVDRIEEATSFGNLAISSLIRHYHSCLRRYGDDNVEYVKISVVTEIEPINMDDEAYLEERRKVALNKLAPDDIKALGIERLAVYNKLRYRSDESNSD